MQKHHSFVYFCPFFRIFSHFRRFLQNYSRFFNFPAVFAQFSNKNVQKFVSTIGSWLSMVDNDNENLEKIVIRCQNGDGEAYSELVDIFGKSLYGYFYRLCGNAAVSNDLLSELFVKLVTKIGSYKGGSFKKWLYTVASNIFYDQLRFQFRQKKLLDGKTDTLRYQRFATHETCDLKDEIQTYMARLDEETAEVLMMRFYSQLSFKELADLRSEPIGTTLSKVHRGLKKLRKMMEDDKKEF